jgi:hypothetical protein
VPDLAIATAGGSIKAAKQAAGEAIRASLDAYREAGMKVPGTAPVLSHLENPEFCDLMFAYVDVMEPSNWAAA